MLFLFYFVSVPGCGGNRLQAKLNKPQTVHYVCSATHDYYDIWLDPTQMLPGWDVDCWVDNMKLSYDNLSRTTKNSPGVDIRVPGWGTVSTMDVVDTTPIINQYDFGYYFYQIIQALVTRGYDRNKNMYGAPYDFRKGPSKFRISISHQKNKKQNEFNSSKLFIM